MTPAPALASVADELYESLGPAASDLDEANGYAFAHVCVAAGAMWQPLADITDPEDGTPGWSAAVDPDRAPAAWLPWLGQLGGVIVPRGTPEAPARSLVRRVAGQRRGRPATLYDAVRVLLNEPKRCHLFERTDPGNAGDFAYRQTMIVRQSDVPAGTEAQITAAFKAALPGGDLGFTVFTNNVLIDELPGTIDASTGTIGNL